MSHGNQLSPRSRAPTRSCNNFVTLLSVVSCERIATLNSRTMSQLSFLNRKRAHAHTAVRTFVLSQRLGVPYEVERVVCAECHRVLEERRLKRAAA